MSESYPDPYALSTQYIMIETYDAGPVAVAGFNIVWRVRGTSFEPKFRLGGYQQPKVNLCDGLHY